MGIAAYRLGYVHGWQGKRRMSHRNGREYDSARDRESYNRGFADGLARKREGQKGKGRS